MNESKKCVSHNGSISGSCNVNLKKGRFESKKDMEKRLCASIQSTLKKDNVEADDIFKERNKCYGYDKCRAKIKLIQAKLIKETKKYDLLKKEQSRMRASVTSMNGKPKHELNDKLEALKEELA